MQAREGRPRADVPNRRTLERHHRRQPEVEIYAIGCGGDLNSAAGRGQREARRQEP